jgi:proline iminopeptidase
MPHLPYHHLTMKKLPRILLKTLAYLTGSLLFLFILFYLLTLDQYEVAETVELDPKLPRIDLNNRLFHAEAFGPDSHDVVVVIHGGPGNDYRYLLPLKALADTYFVVFYDQRGTGLSARVPAAEFTLDNMIADLDAVVDHYAGDRKVNLIGHSWGAMLASGYICRHPGKVKQVVLAEPGLLTSEDARVFMEKVRIKPSLGLLVHFGKCWFQSLHVRGPDDQAGRDYLLQSLILGMKPEQNPYAGYYCNRDPSTGSFDYWRFGALASSAMFRNAMDEDGNLEINLVDGVENFPGKILLLASECNTIIGLEQQRVYLDYYPDAELVVIEEAGHTMFGERPEKCLEIIRHRFGEP